MDDRNSPADAGSPVTTGSAHANLADLVRDHATAQPEVTALVEPGPVRRTRNWAELDADLDRLARGLAAYGMIAGHRVGLLGPNSLEFVLGYLAVLRAGCVAVPINPQLTPVERAAIFADSGLRLLLTAEPAADVPSGVQVVPLTAAGFGAMAIDAGDARDQIDSPRDREALAALLYTAGTSGRSKAAMLTHRALLSHLEHLDALGIITADTTVLAVLPLFHVFGLNAVLGSWLWAGATLVVVDGLDTLFEVVEAERPDNLPLAPAMLQRLLHDPRCATGLGPVKTVVSGAAPLPAEVAAEFTARTGIRLEQGYGLTEAAPGVSVTLGGAAHGHGHVGRPLPGVEVRIGDGAEPTEPGEIWVRGDNLFSGYWPNGAGGPDADGWFPTGDIGYLEEGELYLVDRARELVIVNGFNVYPAEVEEAIAELAGVDSVAVVGRPNPRTGEQVVAFVTGSGLTEGDIEAHCATRLARFKRPGLVRLVDELPRGATGKVRKGVLREDVAADRTDAGGAVR